jgi:hypothetical protein
MVANTAHLHWLNIDQPRIGEPPVFNVHCEKKVLTALDQSVRCAFCTCRIEVAIGHVPFLSPHKILNKLFGNWPDYRPQMEWQLWKCGPSSWVMMAVIHVAKTKIISCVTSWPDKITTKWEHIIICRVLLHNQTPRSPVVTICTASLTFNNSMFCPHSVFMFCVDLRINNDYFPIQH